MRLWAGLMLAWSLSAQGPAPLGIVRGTLVSLREAEPFGELAIQTSEKQTYQFAFNLRTYAERGRNRIAIASIRTGDAVEILSDIGPNPSLRYARIVHLADPYAPPRPALRPWRSKPYVSPTENIVPRGDLTFSGIIRQLNPDMLVLRTRIDGDKQILLRPDTRFLEAGNVVDASLLKPNVRIYVRAGKNLDGDIEAYQVVWGQILDPSR